MTPVSETCGYRSNPQLEPNKFCGLTKEQHKLALHSFMPSNIVVLHITGQPKPVECMKCNAIWFLKEDEVYTCVACTQKYMTIPVARE